VRLAERSTTQVLGYFLGRPQPFEPGGHLANERRVSRLGPPGRDSHGLRRHPHPAANVVRAGLLWRLGVSVVVWSVLAVVTFLAAPACGA